MASGAVLPIYDSILPIILIFYIKKDSHCAIFFALYLLHIRFIFSEFSYRCKDFDSDLRAEGNEALCQGTLVPECRQGRSPSCVYCISPSCIY